MIAILQEITSDLNDKTPEGASSPSQLIKLEPATTAGFSFMNTYGGKAGHNHRPPGIYRGKKWYVHYSYWHNGKWNRFRVYEDINRYTGQAQEEYAQDLKTAVNLALKEGYSPFKETDLTPVKTWTLVQGLNYFKQSLPDRGLRKRTVQTYQSVLREMYKGLSGLLQKEINQITKKDISIYLTQAKRGNNWANTTYNNNITALKAIFNYLVEQEILKDNPAKSIKPLPATPAKHKYFDDETWEKIKKNADPALFRFLMFLYHTGTRPNEARQLKYDHILRDRKLLWIPKEIAKKRERYVPLSDFILENFKGTGVIFGTSVNYFTQKFHTLKIKLKLDKHQTLYSVKHTRGVHLAQDGASPYAIMELFGHSGLHITMAYLRDLGMTVNREAADKAR